MLFIYEVNKPERITFPVKSKEAYIAEEWCKEHLRKIVQIAGKFKWTDDGRTFFDHWFRHLPVMEDEVLEGFYESKDVLATKVGMLLAIAQPEPELVLRLAVIPSVLFDGEDD